MVGNKCIRTIILAFATVVLSSCAYTGLNKNNPYFGGYHTAGGDSGITASIPDRRQLPVRAVQVTQPAAPESLEVPEALSYQELKRQQREDAEVDISLVYHLYGPDYNWDYQSRLWGRHMRHWDRIPWYAWDPWFYDPWMDPWYNDPWWPDPFRSHRSPWHFSIGFGHGYYYDPWRWAWDPYGYYSPWSSSYYGGYYSPYYYYGGARVAATGTVQNTQQRRSRDRKDVSSAAGGGTSRRVTGASAGSPPTVRRPSSDAGSLSRGGSSSGGSSRSVTRSSSSPKSSGSNSSGQQSRTRKRKD